MHVCLCDSDGQPQCANVSYIFTNISVYHGETFTLSACVVGYDFGITVGVVNAGFLHSNHLSRLETSQYNQLVNSSEGCLPVNYTVISKQDNELLLRTSVLPVTAFAGDDDYAQYVIEEVSDCVLHDCLGCIGEILLTTPVFVQITLRSGCPPGLTLNHDVTMCSCYSVLADDGFKCSIQSSTGFLQWNNSVWVNATFNDEGHSTAWCHL